MASRAKKRKAKRSKTLRSKRAKKKVKRKVGRRTTMYGSKGKKLYAVRDASGRFKDIQTYKRAHGMDIKRASKNEGKVPPGVRPPK